MGKVTIDLPCKVGDYVYKVSADKRVKKPYKCEVVGMWLSKNPEFNSIHIYYEDPLDKLNWFNVELLWSDLGHSWFLTEKEALGRIKERKNI